MRVNNFLRHQAKTRALAPRRLAVALSAGRRPICQRACGMQLDRVWRALLAPLPPLLPIALSLPYPIRACARHTLSSCIPHAQFQASSQHLKPLTAFVAPTL